MQPRAGVGGMSRKKRFRTASPIDVGAGYWIDLTFLPGGIRCEWSPDVPDPVPPEVSSKYEVALHLFISARLHRVTGPIGLGIKTEMR